MATHGCSRYRPALPVCGMIGSQARSFAKLQHAAAVTGTDSEQNLENNQTVPDEARTKYLKSLLGAQGLEPWIR
jgi:hypothetical protein